MPSKTNHYQNTRRSCWTDEALFALMQRIHGHPMLSLISREGVFAQFYLTARKDGQNVTAARTSAALEMLRLLDLIAANVPD